MAVRDVRPIKSNHSRGGWGGSGRTYDYDDEGRGKSKGVWEWFESHFNENPTLAWLMSLPTDRCYWLLKYSVERYRLMDIAYHWTPGWNENADTRAHRLVVSELDEADWVDFHAHLLEGYAYERDRIEKERHEAAEKQAGKWAAYEAQLKAERIQIERDDWEKIAEPVDVTAGMLSSELNQVFVYHDKVSDHGDWIEDMVETYQSGEGWGREEEKATGIKIQVTVSLDLSNSMYYNGCHAAAAASFRELGMTLQMLKAMYPDDLYVSFFTFSDDNWDERGKRVLRYAARKAEGMERWEGFQDLRPSVIEKWYSTGIFDGTDTWFAPLFENIEKWENEESDSGAVRLDIVITDAVFEHKTDIQQCDKIQERRDGSLQTVILNFMPETEWVMSTLPKRCFMLKVDPGNIGGVLRNVMSEFVGANL